jgi:hypothetical protein
LERLRVGVLDLLIAVIALVPWRTALLVTLQLSIVVRTFDAYLKWALPILFVCGPIFAYIRDRRSRAAAAKDLARTPRSVDASRPRVIRLGSEDYELRLY